MDARGRRMAHCKRRGGDERILTSELSEVFHGVELSVAKQRPVVVLAEVDWWRVMEECGIARACPYPGIELRQRDPPSAFHVKVFIAASVHLIAEHIVPPDLAEERVGEANEEPWAEWDPLSPACAREERVDPDLQAGVRGGNSEVCMRVALDEVELVPERLVRLDCRRDKADRIIPVLGVMRRMVCYTTGEGGHRIGKESGCDDVGVPSIIAVSRNPPPGGHDAAAGRIDGIEGR